VKVAPFRRLRDEVSAVNVRFLIDTITQQTTVLVAQLATSGGIRAPLAHMSNQVFLELSRELDEVGVTRKVAADMFGLALRSYQAKVRRLEESETGPDRKSLWEMVYEYIQEEGPLSRQEVLRRFRHDDEASVRGILYDLVENGMVFESGSQDRKIYRAASDEEFERFHGDDDHERLYWSAWMYVYRSGPISFEQLDRQLSADSRALEEVLGRLVDEGRLQVDRDDSEAVYRSDDCFIPKDEPAGWEAAFYDHFTAVTTVLASKLRQMQNPTLPADQVGGSTYTFDVWEGHPLRDEVRDLLSRFREEVSELNERVRAHNESREIPEDRVEEVVFYLGQTILDQAD
jgi:predicted transcriptional regulator